MCLSVAVDRPEDVLASGVHVGYEWMIVHNRMGYRCGYVRVPIGHPWYKKTYDEIEVEVHGGLTFSEADVPCNKDGEDNGWWIGFDCAHAWDLPDPSLTCDRKFTSLDFGDGEIRTQEYVETECKNLCEQVLNASK